MQKESGAITNVNVDVSKRGSEGSVRAGGGINNIVRVPVTPSYAATTGEDT